MARQSNRRQFFEQSFRSLVKPFAEYLETRIGAGLPIERTVLRPPGAIPEADFLDTCYRCGNCVEACPADAIRLLPSPDEARHNTPVIDPDMGACVICDDLACMKACPSGALRLVDAVADIRMGLAHFYEDRCVRSHGESCTQCVDLCPLQDAAIRLDDRGVVEVLSPGCVGCGVCQLHCPTQPRALLVKPLDG